MYIYTFYCTWSNVRIQYDIIRTSSKKIRSFRSGILRQFCSFAVAVTNGPRFNERTGKMKLPKRSFPEDSVMWTIAKKIPRVLSLSAQTLAPLLLYPRPSGQKLIIVRNRDEREILGFSRQHHVVIKTGDISVYFRRNPESSISFLIPSKFVREFFTCTSCFLFLFHY